MKYDHAEKLARSGKWVRRPHWHFVYLTSQPDGRGEPGKRILIIVDEDGKRVENSRPDRLSKRDKNATDWELVETYVAQ